MGQDLKRTIENDDVIDCPDCDSTTTLKWCTHTFLYGEGKDAAELTVRLPFEQCSECGLQLLGEEGMRLKHIAICEYLGVLSPEKIREIRHDHTMSKKEFAELTGLGEESLDRWERGASIQSRANDRYLRLLKEPNCISRLRSIGNQ